MYSKLFVFVLSAAAIASALPGGGADGSGAGNVWNKTEEKCNVGHLQCCDNFQHSNSQNAQNLSGPLGVALGTINGLVGVNCVPIAALIGVNGNNCNASPACCKGNKMGGLVTAGCTPINANL